MNNKKQICILVSGKVQEVGFRSFTKNLAQKFGVLGQVKNLPDERVEIIAKGNENILEKFIEKIKNSSPGKIEKIQINEIEKKENFESFNVVS